MEFIPSSEILKCLKSGFLLTVGGVVRKLGKAIHWRHAYSSLLR